MMSKLNSLTGIAGAALVAIVLGAHPCAAQTASETVASETVKVAFAYHPEDPAEKIYSHLQSVARDACADHGSRSLRMDMHARTCARELLDRAVAGIGRADLARLHNADMAVYADNASVKPAPLAIAAR